MSKRKSVIGLLLILVIIIGLAYVSLYGLKIGSYMIPSVSDQTNGIRRGLDLVGGSVITFEAQIDETKDASAAANLSKNMDTAVAMLRERLDFMGYSEAQIYKMGTKRIRVEIPAISNPEDAIKKLGSTAQLQFVDADGNVVLTGDLVDSATPEFSPVEANGPDVDHVAIKFKQAAVAKFAEATAKYSTADMIKAGKNHVKIVLDGEVKSDPYFDKELNTDSIIITGSFTPEETKWLANVINAGQLPFSLKDVELRSVGPSLGEKALETCLTAGLIGLILVMLFMIFIYRIPGFLSSVILVGYVAIVCLILSIFKINLSLPGIAGIILSIGMAVDANVVIFERIKEELRSGKSLKASIASGFHRAFTAIFDSNITTIIAAVVLYYFGTGTIQGFAVTLFIGVVVSMFTAIVITRMALNYMVGLDVKNIKAYGA